MNGKRKDSGEIGKRDGAHSVATWLQEGSDPYEIVHPVNFISFFPFLFDFIFSLLLLVRALLLLSSSCTTNHPLLYPLCSIFRSQNNITLVTSSLYIPLYSDCNHVTSDLRPFFLTSSFQPVTKLFFSSASRWGFRGWKPGRHQDWQKQNSIARAVAWYRR